ncbi:thioredoxin domain-containing protein 17 isoform X1 [Eurosta solidaginis]|uniref:thioredoxin domain-containing protein 17 isoform X1 n=1 Tax=Eurosta solidaginis TaxID=178769 RepID=UPI0035312994
MIKSLKAVKTRLSQTLFKSLNIATISQRLINTSTTHEAIQNNKAMVIQHDVKGYDEFTKLVEKLETSADGQPIHVLFSGGKDESGQSWCPYCVKAEPVVHEALPKAPEKSHFIHVDVGERSYWKGPNCPLRTDARLKLVWVPTLMRWKTPIRIDSENVTKKELVDIIFDEPIAYKLYGYVALTLSKMYIY